MSNTNFQKFLFLKANESIKTNLNNYHKLHEQTDRIIVWLVGFSITAITLLIANFNNTNPFINYISGIIIIFSGLTVVLGILYRIFLLLFQKSDLELIISFDQFVSGYDLPKDIIYSNYVTDKNTSFKEVAKMLEEDFNRQFQIQDFSKLSLEMQKNYHQQAINLYNELLEKKLNYEVEIFEKNLSDLLGTKTVEKKKQKSNNRKVWKYLRITNFLFNATCITFLVGIIILISLYFTYEIPKKQLIENSKNDTKTIIVDTVLKTDKSKISDSIEATNFNIKKLDTLKVK